MQHAATPSLMLMLILWSAAASALEVIPVPCERTAPIDGSSVPSNGHVYVDGSASATEASYFVAIDDGPLEPATVTMVQGDPSLALIDVSGSPPGSEAAIWCESESLSSVQEAPVGRFRVGDSADSSTPGYEILATDQTQGESSVPLLSPPRVILETTREVVVEDDWGIVAYEVLRRFDDDLNASITNIILLEVPVSDPETLVLHDNWSLAPGSTMCVRFVLVDLGQNRSDVGEEICALAEGSPACRCTRSAGQGLPLAALLVAGVFAGLGSRRRAPGAPNAGDRRSTCGPHRPD